MSRVKTGGTEAYLASANRPWICGQLVRLATGVWRVGAPWAGWHAQGPGEVPTQPCRPCRKIKAHTIFACHIVAALCIF